MIVKSLSVEDEQLSELESNLDVSNGYRFANDGEVLCDGGK